MQPAALAVELFDLLHAAARGEKVERVSFIDAQQITKLGLTHPRVAWHLHAGHDRTLATEALRRGTAADTYIVAEVETVAVVALPHGSRLEPAGQIVLRDPDLVVAVREVGGIDESELLCDVLAHGEPGARIGLAGNHVGLDSHVGEAGGALDPTSHGRANPAGQMGEHLLASNIELFAAHLVQRPARDEQGHDVGLGQHRIRGQRRFGVTWRAGDRQGDVVVPGGRIQPEVEGREICGARR